MIVPTFSVILLPPPPLPLLYCVLLRMSASFIKQDRKSHCSSSGLNTRYTIPLYLFLVSDRGVWLWKMRATPTPSAAAAAAAAAVLRLFTSIFNQQKIFHASFYPFPSPLSLLLLHTHYTTLAQFWCHWKQHTIGFIFLSSLIINFTQQNSPFNGKTKNMIF